MPNWSDGEGGCHCPSGQAAGIGWHRNGDPGCCFGSKISCGKSELQRLEEQSAEYEKLILEACFPKTSSRRTVTKSFIKNRIAAAFEAGWKARTI